MEQNKILKRLNHHLDYVKKNGLPGALCRDLAEISGLSENMTVISNNIKENQVCFKIPFAGSTLILQLLFYHKEPWMSPEILLDDEDFMLSISPEDLDEQVPTLNNWNYNDDSIIVQLLNQLLQLYKRYQLENLEHNDYLQYEYNSILKKLDIGDEDIEVVVGATSVQPSMLIRLPLNLQDVPPVLIDANPGQIASLIEVSYENNGTFTTKLHLSPHVNTLIGGWNSLALPSVPPGTCLVDYIERVMELLDEKVKRSILHFETRKQFIAQVLCQFGCAVVEYDANKFSKIVLLCESKDFHFLVFIDLESPFPQQAPKVTLQSLYHSTSKGPFSQELQEIPFKSHWNTEEMVLKMKQRMLAKITPFQMQSVRVNT